MKSKGARHDKDDKGDKGDCGLPVAAVVIAEKKIKVSPHWQIAGTGRFFMTGFVRVVWVYEEKGGQDLSDK